MQQIYTLYNRKEAYTHYLYVYEDMYLYVLFLKYSHTYNN